jgi:hypothetical protein
MSGPLRKAGGRLRSFVRRDDMRRIAGLLAVALVVGSAAPGMAAPINLGDPIPTVARVIQGGSRVDIYADCTYDEDVDLDVGIGLQTWGGATLLAALAPGGPVVGVVPLPPRPVPSDESWCPSLNVPGPPAGTYYVVMVFGFTNATSAPPSAWQQVVVQPRCTGRPLPPVNASGLPLIVGSQVSLGFTGNSAGCGIDRIDLEIGTTPGGTELGVIPLQGFNTSFPAVPPGTYYARARGVNASGASQPSLEVPIQIPNQCAFKGPQGPLNATVSVAGHTVTFDWTQTIGGTLFYEFTVMNDAGAIIDNILLPPTTHVVAAGVPSGSYRVKIYGGNACGMTSPVSGYLAFTVP